MCEVFFFFLSFKHTSTQNFIWILYWLFHLSAKIFIFYSSYSEDNICSQLQPLIPQETKYRSLFLLIRSLSVKFLCLSIGKGKQHPCSFSFYIHVVYILYGCFQSCFYFHAYMLSLYEEKSDELYINLSWKDYLEGNA